MKENRCGVIAFHPPALPISFSSSFSYLGIDNDERSPDIFESRGVVVIGERRPPCPACRLRALACSEEQLAWIMPMQVLAVFSAFNNHHRVIG